MQLGHVRRQLFKGVDRITLAVENHVRRIEVDPDLVAVLAEADPLGAAVTVTSTENGNRALLR